MTLAFYPYFTLKKLDFISFRLNLLSILFKQISRTGGKYVYTACNMKLISYPYEIGFYKLSTKFVKHFGTAPRGNC